MIRRVFGEATDQTERRSVEVYGTEGASGVTVRAFVCITAEPGTSRLRLECAMNDALAHAATMTVPAALERLERDRRDAAGPKPGTA